MIVADAGRDAAAAAAALEARATLLRWHERFSRFLPGSEISRLNAASAATLQVSPLLARIVQAGLDALKRTGGLVDIGLGTEIAGAGYAEHLEPGGLELHAALGRAPGRRAAAPRARSGLERVVVDLEAATISRPPGLVLDIGGIAKGVFADELAQRLEQFDAYVVDCAGDLRIGGRARVPRPVHVAPADGLGAPLHTFTVRSGAIATSGIGRRAWRSADGQPAHHLLDPSTGLPAFTGLVQATALATTGAVAESLAKAALLSGPERAAGWLADGGALVREDGGVEVVRASSVLPDPAPAGAGGRYAGAAALTGLRVEIQPSRSSSTRSRSGSFKISWNRPS